MPHSRPDTRFIFVTGGVVSSLGKGIAAASIGRLLVARGMRVTLPHACVAIELHLMVFTQSGVKAVGFDAAGLPAHMEAAGKALHQPAAKRGRSGVENARAARTAISAEARFIARMCPSRP